MRTAALLLLLFLPSTLFAGKDALVKDEEHNFEISMPPNSIDWVRFPVSKDKSRAHIRAHFQTEYADTDPPSTCDVQLMVVGLTKQWARQSLDRIAMQWQPQMEAALASKRDIKEGKKKLAGQEFYYRDMKGEFIAGVGHITWYLGRMGKYLYSIYILRTYKAVDDDMLEEEIDDILKSFKYLKVIAVKADKKAKSKGKPPEVGPGGGGGGGAATDRVDPDKIKREKVKLAHWRLELVKPKEMFNIDPLQFSKSEKSNNVIAKFNRRVQQSFVEIRIYAQSTTSQKYTLDQLAKSTLKFWEKTYKNRLKPEIDEKYKFPMAKKAIKMRLVGRRTVPETYTWILAQCKNDRQYRISIYTTGATGEQIWKAQIEDFLKNIKPLKK
ncbi:MAG: hypothetical protein ACYTG3_06390 [Planctomycetota bacterium]|jgi:hypothetical protein